MHSCTFRYNGGPFSVAKRFVAMILIAAMALCLFGCSSNSAPASIDEADYRARIEGFGDPLQLDDNDLTSLAELYETLRSADLLTESDYEALAAIYSSLGDAASECSVRYDLYMLFPTEERAADVSALVVPADESASNLLDQANSVLEQIVESDDAAQAQGTSSGASSSSDGSSGNSSAAADGGEIPASSPYTSLLEIVDAPEWNAEFRLGSGVIAKTTSAETAAGDWRIRQDDAATSLTRISDDRMIALVIMPEKGMQLFMAEAQDGKPHGAFTLRGFDSDNARTFQLTGTIDGTVMTNAITVVRNGATYAGTLDANGHVTTSQDGGAGRLVYARSGDDYLYTNAGTQADFVMDMDFWGIPVLGLEELSDD